MIFVSRKLIYLHVQKTGGNSVTKTLLPYSDDEMTLRRHQDAVDRFGIKGAYTERKHAHLSEYKEALGDQFVDFQVALPIRDPFERAVSLYFSPHKWMIERDNIWHPEDPYWDIERFEKLVAGMNTLVGFVMIEDVPQIPDHVVRFSQLEQDFAELCKTYEFPIADQRLPKSNRSAASDDLRKIALADARAATAVRARFAADYDLIDVLDKKFPPDQNKVD